jgi:NADH-quinone oxidoreductase subunit N
VNADTINALLDFFPWIIPECILGFFACVLFLGGSWKVSRHAWGTVALVALIGAGIALLVTGLPTFASRTAARSTLYVSPIWLDRLTLFIKAVSIVGGAVFVLFSWDEVSEEHAAEYHACLLTIVAGSCFTAAANDLVTLFLSLELISIPTYVALYLARSDDAGKEAGVKYFLLSIFSSAILLFGFSYLYGLAGTTNLQGVADALAHGTKTEEAPPGLALVAVVLIVAGLCYKMTAVPFHFYAPDVYQGTSTGAAALLAFLPKMAGFIAVIRVLGFLPFELTIDAAAVAEGVRRVEPDVVQSGSGPLLGAQVSTLLWIVAAVTMTLGNILALLQDNIKRMLAYSSVAHAGYMLIGLTIAPWILLGRNPALHVTSTGVDAVLFYLVSYGAMTVGAFAVLAYLSTRQRSVETVDDLGGLSQTHPGVALLMTLFLLSLIGIPATAGFVGKFLLFFGAFSYQYDLTNATAREMATLFRVLALIGVINAAIGGWYYLRIIAAMYLRSPLQPLAKPAVSPRLVAIWACALVTLVFGLYPKPLLDRARAATANTVHIQASEKAALK